MVRPFGPAAKELALFLCIKNSGAAKQYQGKSGTPKRTLPKEPLLDNPGGLVTGMGLWASCLGCGLAGCGVLRKSSGYCGIGIQPCCTRNTTLKARPHQAYFVSVSVNTV